MAREMGPQTIRYTLGSPFAKRSFCKSRIGAKPLQVHLLKWVVRFRIGAVATATRLAERGRLPAAQGAKCPFCSKNQPECIYHMVFECSRWGSLRNKYIADVITQAGEVRDRIVSDPKMPVMARSNANSVHLNLVLGGAYSGCGLTRWMPPRPGPKGEDESSVNSSSTMMAIDPDDEASEDDVSLAGETDDDMCYTVGSFLAKMMALWGRPLQPLIIEASASTSGQRPTG